MAGKVSAAAAGKLAHIELLQKKLQNVHGLVEQFAAAKVNQNVLCQPIQRGLTGLKREFMGAGLDALCQTAGALAIAAGRGTAPQTKARILREGVGSLRFQLEMEQRAIVAEDEAKQADKDAKHG